MVFGVLGVVGIAVTAIMKLYRMKYESFKASGMTKEDREAIRDLRASVQRIESLETILFDRADCGSAEKTYN